MWQKGHGSLSFQVLFEFQEVLSQKLAEQVDFQKRKEIAEDLSKWSAIIPTRALLLKAIDFQKQHQLSWWDSLIVVSAIDSHATPLLTEDLNHGQRFENVTVANPFISPTEHNTPNNTHD